MELAKVVIYGYRYGPDIYKNALCEWDILGRSGQEVYIWAYCATIEGDVDRIRPAVIYLEANGIIRKVKIAGFKGPDFNLDLFPKDVQEKLDEYYFNVCVNCGRPEELRTHLLYRETHPEVPPLVVLSAKPTVTPAP